MVKDGIKTGIKSTFATESTVFIKERDAINIIKHQVLTQTKLYDLSEKLRLSENTGSYTLLINNFFGE